MRGADLVSQGSSQRNKHPRAILFFRWRGVAGPTQERNSFGNQNVDVGTRLKG